MRSDDYYRHKLCAQSEITESGCWEWKGYVHPNGYGGISYRNKSARVHRISYTLFHGPIPEGMDVCHACDFRRCINPAHLWAGDQRANSLDVVVKGRHYAAAKTHCPQGHAYADHLYTDPRGYRNCKTCARIRQRIRAGWPVDVARIAPVTPHGQRPVNAKFDRDWGGRKPRIVCKHGHPLTPENVYVSPTGQRQCKACRKVRVIESAARRAA